MTSYPMTMRQERGPSRTCGVTPPGRGAGDRERVGAAPGGEVGVFEAERHRAVGQARRVTTASWRPIAMMVASGWPPPSRAQNSAML